jgi:hypothetical protein
MSILSCFLMYFDGFWHYFWRYFWWLFEEIPDFVIFVKRGFFLRGSKVFQGSAASFLIFFNDLFRLFSGSIFVLFFHDFGSPVGSIFHPFSTLWASFWDTCSVSICVWFFEPKVVQNGIKKSSTNRDRTSIPKWCPKGRKGMKNGANRAPEIMKKQHKNRSRK